MLFYPNYTGRKTGIKTNSVNHRGQLASGERGLLSNHVLLCEEPGGEKSFGQLLKEVNFVIQAFRPTTRERLDKSSK